MPRQGARRRDGPRAAARRLTAFCRPSLSELLLLLLCSIALPLAWARADAPGPRATQAGGDLTVHGPPGGRVVLLDATEKRIAEGRIGAGGSLLLRGKGTVDPMLRLVEIDGARRSLADLFPKVELLAVFPRSVSAGIPIVPHVRVVERGTRNGVAGVPVEILCRCGGQKGRERSLGKATSGVGGTAEPLGALSVPAGIEGECSLIASAAGARIEGSVKVTKGVRLVVSTDRPVYQPGQTIHVRGLATDTASGLPARRAEAELELRDSRGAVLARKKVATSEFGVANAAFPLPEHTSGEKVTLQFASGGQEATVGVKLGRYVVPKVTVEATPARPTFRAGEQLAMDVRVARLDGAPVRSAQVELVARDPESGTLLFRARASSDGTGAARLGGRVPEGPASIAIRVRGETTGGDAGTVDVVVPVDDGSLRVFVVPESGGLVGGLENRVWVVAELPDGSPSEADVTMHAGGRRARAKTEADGIAWVPITVPKDAGTLMATARAGDRHGARTVEVAKGPAALLRVDPVVASPGEEVTLTYLTGGAGGIAVMDVVQGEHSVASRAAQIEKGRATATFRLPQGSAGTLRVHGWHMEEGRVVGDARLVLARDARDLRVELVPDRETYRPREEATVDIRVRDANGRPVVAALGLVAVDAGLRPFGLQQPGVEQALTRIGERWDRQAVVAPEWAREALYQADDRKRLAVLAAAAEVAVELQQPKDTAAARARASAEAFRPAVERRAKLVGRALTRYYSKRSRKDKPVALRTLLGARLVAKEAATDPWGRRMRMALEDSCCNYSVTMTSAGLDGQFGSGDDVSARAGFEGYHTYYCGCGFGMGMAGMGAGGGGMVRHLVRLGSVMSGGAARQGKPTALRSEFPETLAVAQELVTDEQGRARWTLRLADSLTRWLVQARAVSRSGGLGGAEVGLQVDQPFSVDVSLPPSLTREDRIDVPLSVTNRTAASTTVRLAVRTGGTLSGAADPLELTVGAGDTRSATLTLNAVAVGEGFVHVEAKALGAGSALMADAVRRELHVVPDGVPVESVASGRFGAGSSAEASIEVPAGGIPGTQRVFLKLYPSAMGTVVEGLASLLAAPSGCFEQTSATTYPNALVLDYLKRTNRASPVVVEKAKAMLDAGWKRLVSYEVSGGGFSWFGDAPANKVLTAFGLMELERIGAVYDKADPAVSVRARDWLLGQRKGDGSWEPDKSYLHASTWKSIQDASLPVTAYITWAASRAGVRGLEPSIRWLKDRIGDADTAYVAALVALALSTADPKSNEARDARSRLADMALESDDGRYWKAGVATHTYSAGAYGDIETTGLATLAFMAGGDQPQLVDSAMGWIRARREAGAGWGTTQATVLSLESLLTQDAGSGKPAVGVATVRAGERTERERITPDDFDVVRTISLPAQPGKVVVDLDLAGEGALSYQLATTRYVRAADAPETDAPLSLDVAPERTRVHVGETLETKLTLTARRDTRMPTVSVGLPAGFEVDEASVRGAGLARAEVLGRRLVLYLTELARDGTFTATWRSTPRRAGLLAAGVATAWPYYEPDRKRHVEQARFEVLP